jgi:hypothetical protein
MLGNLESIVMGGGNTYAMADHMMLQGEVRLEGK